MIGKEIHHYKILEKLGEGGMGVVYKAQDTKLDRIVALKFLPTHSLGNDDDRKRFETEAKAAAALNHPNIATVYEINDHEGDTFIAMEFVDGDTLEDKIKKAPLKIKDAIKIAKQVADGLAAAHEKDIFHRDIKGSNVMVTAKGVVKIMDFGLAKMSSATIVTKAGMTLGTVGYMSPEQSKGEVVDHRTDIWSLGVVFYEMIAGVRPFKGEYETALVYSILNVDPEPLTGLRTGVPMDLEKIINKLLAKDPDERYQNIIELPVDLKNVDLKNVGTSAMGSSVLHQSNAVGHKSIRRSFEWKSGVLASIVTAVVIFLIMWVITGSNQVQENRDLVQFQFEHEQSISIMNSLHGNKIAISPNGKIIVYIAFIPGSAVNALYKRDLRSNDITMLEGTENAYNPFFSPDGRWIAFNDGVYLKRMRIEESSPLNIAEVNPYARGGSWNNNDQIVFTKGGNEGLNLVDINTGEVTVLTIPNIDSNEISHMWPEFLPNGKDVLFTIYKTGEFDNSRVALYSLENNTYRILFNQPGVNAKYAASGHLVYYRTGEILAVPFDIKNYKITGDPVVITNDLVLPGNFNDGHATYDFSENGTYTFITNSDNVINYKLILFDRQGNTVKVLLENQAIINFPRISPDNKRVAYTVSESEVGEIHIEIVDLDNINRKLKATYEPGMEGYPVWSNDSKKLYYFSHHSGFVADIHWVSSSGDNIGGELLKMTNPIYPISISPNGLLAFYEINPESSRDIWMYSFKDSTRVPFIANSANETSPEFSPNGKWLAYSSNETGSDEVYVTSMEDKSKRWKISAAGGNLVSWNSNGRELFYFENNTLMSVPVKTDNNFEYGIPQRLFSNDFNFRNAHFPNYDHISTTDQFITVIIEPENDNPRINVVLNWFEELKRLAPVNKE